MRINHQLISKTSQTLTFPLPSLLGPHLLPMGGGGASRTLPSYLKTHCPHEHEIMQGIRDTFESLRNVTVVYIVFTWLPKQLLKGEVFWGKIARFQPKIPIIQIATTLAIFKIIL